MMKKVSLFSLCSVISLLATDYKTDAATMGGYFKNNFQSAIAKPATENTSFSTVNGSKSFSSQITCNVSKVPVAEISYTGTSDISISIKLDTNVDGSIDKTNTITGVVSGICADGVIKCDANSWTNCTYQAYKFSTSTGFYLQQQANLLSGCYCINSSCGSKAANYKEEILNDIAGAVYTTMSSSLSNFILTKTNATTSGVSIYGENPDGCKNYKEGTKTYNQATLNNDGEDAFATQSNDVDSPVHIVKTVHNNPELAISKTDIQATSETRVNSIARATENNKVVSTTFGDTDMNTMENINEPKYCQVVKSVANGHIYTDNTTAQTSNTTNTTVEDLELRECTGVNKNICPYETGETVKYACGEVNQGGFAESLSAMSGLNEMAKDISCSSN